MVPIKNHELFLKAIQHLTHHSSKKIRAFIIGDGESRGIIEQKSRDLSLEFGGNDEERLITFTSWIRDVSQVYPGLDIVTLTSLNEGTPVSLIEAQACNTPIVSTNVGGIDNIVLQHKTALLSDLNDQESFCKNLLKVVDNTPLRLSFGEHGWNHVQEKFSHQRLSKDMKQLYHVLLKKHKK